ncbi:MAG: hypothetical protein AAF991_03330 [Pseudomonadota bacterium]
MDNDQESGGGKTVVCYVCRKYFLDIECTETEFDGFICHECSGEKPVGVEPEQEATPGSAPKAAADKTKEKTESKVADAKGESLMAPGLEWMIIAVCLFVIVIRLATSYGGGEEELELASQRPEDIATYCLDVLDSMERKGASISVESVRDACFPPLEVQADERGILVTAPDPDFYGYSEILIESEPTVLTVTE